MPPPCTPRFTPHRCHAFGYLARVCRCRHHTHAARLPRTYAHTHCRAVCIRFARTLYAYVWIYARYIVLPFTTRLHTRFYTAVIAAGYTRFTLAVVAPAPTDLPHRCLVVVLPFWLIVGLVAAHAYAARAHALLRLPVFGCHIYCHVTRLLLPRCRATGYVHYGCTRRFCVCCLRWILLPCRAFTVADLVLHGYARLRICGSRLRSSVTSSRFTVATHGCTLRAISAGCVFTLRCTLHYTVLGPLSLVAHFTHAHAFGFLLPHTHALWIYTRAARTHTRCGCHSGFAFSLHLRVDVCGLRSRWIALRAHADLVYARCASLDCRWLRLRCLYAFTFPLCCGWLPLPLVTRSHWILPSPRYTVRVYTLPTCRARTGCYHFARTRSPLPHYIPGFTTLVLLPRTLRSLSLPVVLHTRAHLVTRCCTPHPFARARLVPATTHTRFGCGSSFSSRCVWLRYVAVYFVYGYTLYTRLRLRLRSSLGYLRSRDLSFCRLHTLHTHTRCTHTHTVALRTTAFYAYAFAVVARFTLYARAFFLSTGDRCVLILRTDLRFVAVAVCSRCLPRCRISYLSWIADLSFGLHTRRSSFCCRVAAFPRLRTSLSLTPPLDCLRSYALHHTLLHVPLRTYAFYVVTLRCVCVLCHVLSSYRSAPHARCTPHLPILPFARLCRAFAHLRAISFLWICSTLRYAHSILRIRLHTPRDPGCTRCVCVCAHAFTHFYICRLRCYARLRLRYDFAFLRVYDFLVAHVCIPRTRSFTHLHILHTRCGWISRFTFTRCVCWLQSFGKQRASLLLSFWLRLPFTRVLSSSPLVAATTFYTRTHTLRLRSSLVVAFTPHGFSRLLHIWLRCRIARFDLRLDCVYLPRLGSPPPLSPLWISRCALLHAFCTRTHLVWFNLCALRTRLRHAHTPHRTTRLRTRAPPRARFTYTLVWIALTAGWLLVTRRGYRERYAVHHTRGCLRLPAFGLQHRAHHTVLALRLQVCTNRTHAYLHTRSPHTFGFACCAFIAHLYTPLPGPWIFGYYMPAAPHLHTQLPLLPFTCTRFPFPRLHPFCRYTLPLHLQYVYLLVAAVISVVTCAPRLDCSSGCGWIAVGLHVHLVARFGPSLLFLVAILLRFVVRLRYAHVCHRLLSLFCVRLRTYARARLLSLSLIVLSRCLSFALHVRCYAFTRFGHSGLSVTSRLSVYVACVPHSLLVTARALHTFTFAFAGARHWITHLPHVRIVLVGCLVTFAVRALHVYVALRSAVGTALHAHALVYRAVLLRLRLLRCHVHTCLHLRYCRRARTPVSLSDYHPPYGLF